MATLLRGGTLIDGTGAPARPADVLIEDGRIAAVGAPGTMPAGTSTAGRTTADLDDPRSVGSGSDDPDSAGVEVVDLDGLVLAPGFIDVHTHYDAQILWDGDLTPSSWHGVTSVVMGNCGFGVAPTKPEHRDVIARTLENVEGMALDALEAGIDWCFESFPEYLRAIDERPKRLNVGAFLGHTPLRLFVVGADERPATEAEVETMRSVLREAIEAGAIGFSTSRQPAHQGAYGRPVPSRFAEVDEVEALASVLGDLGRGVIQVSIGPGLFVDQFSDLATRHGVPVTWTALVARADKPGAALRTVERGAALPGEVYPQIACRPIVMQITLNDPVPFAEIDVWKEVLALPRPERAALYADATWRDRARHVTVEAWAHRWPKTSVEETGRHHDAVGVPLDELAAARGTTPFDLLLDLALADDMATRFRIVLDNDGDDEIGDLLADKRTLLGLSDAGAHASQLCDACYSTHLLGHWVRERKALSLEDAVWRLTGHPHQAFRVPERGLVQAGFFADLVAFDPDTVGTTPVERVHDQPGGADRLVVGSTGIEHVWVNGVPTRTAGTDLPGTTPGRLIRS